jgi:superfamily II DNA or RNA helicase
MVLTEGWDMPDIGCCILARPTKRIGLYLQMVGRVLRAAPGKEDAIILDHAGAVWRHGRPEDRIQWTLDPCSYADVPEQRAREKNKSVGMCECPECSALRLAGQPCLACGWEPKKPSLYVATRNDDLALFKNGRSYEKQYSKEEREL